jgi:hypothetical protein
VSFCLTSIVYIMSVNFDLMEKVNFKGCASNCLNNLKILKKSSIDHLQRLKDFEIEKDVFIGKIKSLEDDIMNSQIC